MPSTAIRWSATRPWSWIRATAGWSRSSADLIRLPSATAGFRAGRCFLRARPLEALSWVSTRKCGGEANGQDAFRVASAARGLEPLEREMANLVNPTHTHDFDAQLLIL